MDQDLQLDDHASLAALQEGLGWIQQSPKDEGRLQAIVIRPKTNDRRVLAHGALSPEGGLEGDTWADGCWKSLPDGRPHPDVQLTLMNARCIDLLARTPTRWPLAGDQLYVDLDLSEANLPAGTRFRIGAAELEITAVPHLGCKKFSQRFGIEATRFVNTREGRALRLRGVYAKVVSPGTVTVGDLVTRG